MSGRTLLTRATRLPVTALSGPSRLFLRAESTSATPFEPALPVGVDPAYDLALAYLEEQNALSRKRLEALKAKAGNKPTPEQAERINKLEIDAWINDPATRRLFRQTDGHGYMDRPVIRALAERKWKKEGELDLVMQRLFQLGVIPDLLPDIQPTAALRLAAEQEIEAGSVQPSSLFASPPNLRLQLFHHPAEPTSSSPAPEALYTLLMIDPDSPNHEDHSFTQRLHYAKSDIPLSILSGETNLISAAGNELVSYEPPAPARGSGKHRYVFVVVKQGESKAAAPARENFDLRSFLSENKLENDAVVAATLIRSEWVKEDDEHINETYLKFRGTPAPVYSKPPKEMKYGYPLSAKAQRANEIREQAWNEVVAEIEGMGQGQIPQ